MNLLDFYRQYPDESSCEEALRRFRERHGLFCSRCGGLRLSWISSKEIQRQLGRKRYQPVWEMVHKLRDVMGKRDARYNLHGDVEIDEGFFSTETPEAQKNCPLKRGRGSQRKTSVLVMAESSFPDTPSDKKRSTPKIVGHIKMEVIDDLKASTETPRIKQATDGKANATTDGSSTYASLEKDGAVASHKAVVKKSERFYLGYISPSATPRGASLTPTMT